MMQTSIHSDTTIGVVSLNIKLLARSIDFYVNVLGFQLRQRKGNQAILGTSEDDLLILNEKPDATHYPARTGLYHLAILVPSRLQLGLNLKKIADSQTPVQGFADHWVSEAIYLADPDGNGIEIYRDRPKEEWPRLNGKLQMGTEALDIDGIMREINITTSPWTGLPQGTKIGHIHLQVADVPTADSFYTNVLGFDLIMHYGASAGFVSAGGYHHHIGYNTWSSLGAGPPPAESIGLAWYTVELPDQPALNAILDHIQNVSWPTDQVAEGVFLRDSSGNGIILRTK